MKCPDCGGEMTPMIISAFCPACDERGPAPKANGWCVFWNYPGYALEFKKEPDEYYYLAVSLEEARRWANAMGRNNTQILPAYITNPPEPQPPTGHFHYTTYYVRGDQFLLL